MMELNFNGHFLSGEMMFDHIFMVMVMIAVVWDLSLRKIPNVVSVSIFSYGFLYNIIIFGVKGVFFSFLGLACGIFLLIFPYAMSGIGAGDVKFLGGVGAYLGWKGVLVAFAYMAVFGGIYALILLALNRDFSILLMKRIKTTVKTIFLTRRSVSLKFQRSKKGPILCYGLPIGLGAFLRVFEKQTGNHLISWLQ